LAAFNAAVMLIPEIEQAHLIAGNFDYLMKIRTRSMAQLDRSKRLVSLVQNA